MASQWPPKKNAAFTLYFSLYKSDGTIIANPGTYTKVVSIDGAAVASIAASVTEEDTTYGQLSVVLASGEMNGDAIWVYIKDDTAGCVPFTCTLYTAGSLHDEMKADTAAILADTGTDGVVVASGSKSGYSLTATTGLGNQTANITGTVSTVTTLTNLPAITAGWLTTAGIADGAFTAAKFASGAFDAVWSVATRVLTAATNLTTALATPTNITAGTITTVSGNVTGSVGSIAAGGITAASLDATVQARLGIVAYGTAQSATGTTLRLDAASTFADDELIGAVAVITGGSAGVGQSRVITDYVSSTDTATVDAWTTTPTGTITYVVFAAPPASATALPAVNVTQFGGAAGTFASGRPEVNTTHVGGTSQTAGNLTSLITTVDTVVDSILVDTAEIGAAGAGLTALATAANLATVDTVVDAILVDTAEIGAAGAGLTALATAANLATVDTVVDAIKVKTDSLTFTQAGHVDANIQRINDVTIVGDGSTTPFNV